MAKSKIHLVIGQGIVDGPCSLTYLAQNADPDEQWYSGTANAAIWASHNQSFNLYSATLSNSWNNRAQDTTLGVNCGPDLSFMRDVSVGSVDTHLLLKLAGDGVLRAGSPATFRWDKVANTLYADIAPNVTAAKAALLAVLPANAVEIGSITIALGYLESQFYTLNAWPDGAAYLAADMSTLIGNLRADLAAITGQVAADIPVQLWRLPLGTRQLDGGPYADVAVDYVRNALLSLRTTINKCEVVDVDQAPLRADFTYPTASGVVFCGERMFAAYQQLTDATVPSALEGGLPVIVYVGQSNCAGQRPVSLLATAQNADPDLVQDYAGKVWTLDWTGHTVETYVPTQNSNTGPDALWNDGAKFGPDVGATPELLARHAATGFCWFKLGVNGASLGVNSLSMPIWLKRYASHVDAVWPTFANEWPDFVQACIAETGRIPHVRLIIVHQGEGDTEVGLYPTYAANLREWIADLRALVQTDTHSEDTIPVAIVRTKDIEGNPWLAAGLAAVRAAQAAVASDAGNFLVDVDDTPSADDHVHDSGEGLLQIGRAVVAALPEWYDSGTVGG